MLLIFIISALFIVGGRFFYINSSSEWMIYTFIVPLIYSLISFFDLKSGSCKNVLYITIGVVFTISLNRSNFDMNLFYRVLYTLTGCGISLIISNYFSKKQGK